jgi:hypothetical protein
VGLAVAMVTMIFGTAGPVVAAEPVFSDQAATVWAQPGSGPLDGLGTFVYVAPPGTPGPTQGSPQGYDYTLTFHLEDGSLGVLALGHKNGQKAAGFGVVDHTLITAVPYDWKYGQIYYVLAYRLSDTQWGAWVYDWAAARWDLIAVQNVPATTGRMLPEAATVVDYSTSPAATCDHYPRIDAFYYPPTGWRGDVMTTATFKERGGFAGYDGPCPSSTTVVNGWHWTTMGQAAG